MNGLPYDHDQRDHVQETSYIIHPVLKTGPRSAKNQNRCIESVIDEAEGLAAAIDLDVLKTRQIALSRVHAGSYLGKGQREDLKADIQDLQPHVVIVNTTLSPVQQRNLEREWQVKVIDRTGLILEIFGERAQTKEGRLQVDLASLAYQRSRLVRSWTHLERQRGGAGFMGGPGERQIEIDRRLIDQRITRLKKQLKTVRRTRELGRYNRARKPYPVIALVGYTNAGKSTLFNRLTGADVFAEDLPFATLDPTMRQIKIPNGQRAILSDTVGFISDLPTHLVEAFKATLEQIVHADVIVHVIDSSRPDWKAQRQDVIDVLEDLGIEYDKDSRIVEGLNKVDLLPENDRSEHERHMRFSDNTVSISAITEYGVNDLLHHVSERIALEHMDISVQIPIENGKALSWLYDHGEVLEYHSEAKHMLVKAKLARQQIERFKAIFGFDVL